MVEELGAKPGQQESEYLSKMRWAYESSPLTLEEIAAEFETSRVWITMLARRGGWKPRRPRVDRMQIIQTMLRVLNRQVTELENSMAKPGEKEVALLGHLARSLDRLIKLDRAEATNPNRKVSRMEEARAKLAQRLAELERS